MIKKLFAIALAAATLSFAQDPYAPEPTEATPYEDMSAYTSGAPAPETPVMNINEVPNDEPLVFLYIHPVSLAIMTIVGLPTFTLTFEGCLTESLSAIVRPQYVMSSYDVSVGDDEFGFSGYGLTLGGRYYLNPLHRGIYIEPELQYAHVSMDFTHGRHKDESVSANAVGVGAVLGWKVTSGHLSMFWDVGFIYAFATADGEYDDDVEKVTVVGASYDINLGIGYAF